MACILVAWTNALSQNIEYRTLPELIDAGSAALEQGNYPIAAQALNAIYRDYREEPFWRSSELPSRILPLAGFASYKSNLHEEAIDVLQTYLKDHADGQADSLFAQYTLASSLLQKGETQAARTLFTQLRAAAQDTPFYDLAVLQEARLSEPKAAIPLLESLIQNPNSPRLARYARIRLISLAYEEGDLNRCRIHLLDTEWPASQLSDSITLSLLATRIAKELAVEEPGNALRAYQLVRTKSQLIAAQRRRIESLKTTYQQIAPTLEAYRSHWSDQLRETVEQLESQLETLQATPDFTDTITLRKARCFVRINRPLEAWILQQSLAQSQSPHARDAHLDWIATAREMRAWQAAAQIAHQFIETYPNDKHIAQPLFWIALSQIELGAFPEAILSLQRVQERTQDPLFLASSHYYIGYCYFMIGQPQAARKAFGRCHETNPKSRLSGQAMLWIGICQFTENQLEAATETFQKIQTDPEQTILHAEAAYRETSARYALGELELAQRQSDSWLQRYPIHPRRAEAHALAGDIALELGQSAKAAEAYQAVETNEIDLAFHALERLCQILIAEQKLEAALAKVSDFKKIHSIPPRLIGSVTQLTLLCLTPEEGQLEIQRVIADYGHIPESIGIVELIRRLKNRTPPADSPPTTLSRYYVSEIRTLLENGKTAAANLKSLQLASDFDIEQLPPPALVEAGKALQKIKSHESQSYFDRVIEQYPYSPYVSESYLQLARLHHREGSYELALATLSRIDQLSGDALQLKLATEIELKRHTAAEATARRILENRQSLPTHKAEALNALGALATRSGSPLDAYAYHQRVFTLYRGEGEQVATAYKACIAILLSENRYTDAQALAEEFLAQSDLAHFDSYQEIQTQPLTSPTQTNAQSTL